MSDNFIAKATDESFGTSIAKGVTLVDFFAEWCGPCRMLGPIIEEVAQAMHTKAHFVKVDTDACQKTAALFQVTSIPTLILFKDGVENKRVVGVRDADALKKMIESAL